VKISLSTNFDPLLIKGLSGSNVSVIYGKLPSDVVGGGRPTFALPQISIDQIKQHIELAHSQGIEFNYLLNAVCLDNLECTRVKNKQILDLLDLLKELEVDWVTVAIPYLIDLVKAHLPDVKVMVSTFANVDSIQKAQYYERLGVNAITLPEQVNRNFNFLTLLRKKVNLDFHLIVTNDCLLSCPFRHHHPLFQSHASQAEHISNGFALDYCLLKCTYQKLKNPEAFIQSPWIRPEDTKYYEEIGINKFKITERMKGTQQLLNIVKAYQERSYVGNLAKLLNVRMDKGDFLVPNFEYNNNATFVDPDKMSEIYQLIFANNIIIDNKKLDGFLEFFIKNKVNCLETDCQECGYCSFIAKTAVSYDVNEYQRLIKQFDNLFNKLTSGDFFSSSNEKVITNVFWSDSINELFNKMIKAKPLIFRRMATNEIRLKAEEYVLQRGAKNVEIEDLVKANFDVTPKKFHAKIKEQLVEIGIDFGMR